MEYGLYDQDIIASATPSWHKMCNQCLDKI